MFQHLHSLHVHTSFCFFRMCATTRFASNASSSGSKSRKITSIFYKRAINSTVCSFSASWHTAAAGTCAAQVCQLLPPGRRHRMNAWRHDLQALHRFSFQYPRAQNMPQKVPKQKLLPPPQHNLPIHPRRWLVCQDHDGHSAQPIQKKKCVPEHLLILSHPLTVTSA